VSVNRAREIVKNLKYTIASMQESKLNITNDNLPPARADKKKLQNIAKNLIKKYNLQESK
jgi:light-regulated signal transduction histidine kinase (bacteriophytochrome)